MFKHDLKIALRIFLKARLFSLINIAGLAIGMATFLLILQYVNFELSYDAFHSKSASIYRVKTNYIRNGELIFDSADNFAGVGPALKRELTEVRDFVRLYNAGEKFNCVITYAATAMAPVAVNEKKLFFADASFFTVFSYPLITGDPTTVLAQPHTAVVSESAAKKYFGNDDPVGKVIQFDDDAGDEESFTITGVFRDLPANSHLQFNLLFSYKTLSGRSGGAERYENSWFGRDNFLTYIELELGTSPESVEAKFPAIIDKYKPANTETDEQGQRIRSNIFVLQPLRDIHLYSHLSNEAEVNGDGKTVYLLAIVAVFILMIAWMNYLNLAAARMFERAKEVGIRKTAGAGHWQLVRQFLAEAVLLNTAALVVAFGLYEITLPYFQLLTGKSLETLSSGVSPLWWLLPIMLMLGTLLAGTYPAFLAVSFTPISTISGRLAHAVRGISLRQILVVFQFVISIALGVATIVVYSQLQFMREHDLGFNPEQILVLKRPARVETDISWTQRYRSFKNELLKYPTVRSVAGSNIVPGQDFMAGLAISRTAGGTLDEVRSFHDFWTDGDFLKTYGMTFLAGRDFLPENAGGGADSSSIILSESAAKQLGFASAEDAVGKDVFLFGSQRHTVIGVIKDYHHEQLQKPQNPTMFNISSQAPDFISIKLDPKNLRVALAAIATVWKEHFPRNPFDFFFLDDFFNAQYQTYERLEKVFSLFAALALIIASLGVLGLVSYAIAQRRKEIGIRKVLGATVTNVTALLSKDFVKLLLFANAIAWPVAWFAMNRWLQNFAYRIDIGWWVFALAGGLALLIALLTVSTQAIKAALANPVESLRYE